MERLKQVHRMHHPRGKRRESGADERGADEHAVGAA
jgi:hypothetical protein